jgi:Inner membrane protein YgaP-like, transmembrane domain
MLVRLGYGQPKPKIIQTSLEEVNDMNFDFKRMVHFEHNVGSKDQKIRYAVGIAALLLAVFKGNIFLLVLGIILVGSAYLTWCPILSGLGKNTCGTDTGAAAPSGEEEQAAASEEPASAPETAAPASEESAAASEEGSASEEAAAPPDEEKP